MGQFYIQTNKFYTTPTYEHYHIIKNAHLHTIDTQYSDIPKEKKWALLMTQFADSLRPVHMPDNIEIQIFQENLAKFKIKRDGTSISHFNLSLSQCVNYFEDFIFLYNTTDPLYKLTDTAKKDLLKSINEAMDVCETGLNGRLYSALQAHQKESDWIQNELVKARCETLRMLHTQYGGEDVHTFNKLVQLANQAQLGIPQKEEILDIHAGMVDSPRVEAFFKEHYPALFATYEKQIEDSLTNHYLSELATTLGIDNTAWADGHVTIPYRQTEDISGSINAYFQSVHTDGILYDIGNLHENGTDYVLNTKQDVAKKIKDLVHQKLINDKYLVTLDQIAKDPKIHQDLRLKNGVKLDELLNIQEALKQNNHQQVQDKLQQNPLILISYPDFLISEISSNPAILSSIPRWLRNDTRFVDSSMIVLNQLLCEAISADNREEIRLYTTQVLNLIQSEYGYLQHLSEPVFKNPLVAAMLVEENGLLFAYMDQSLQENTPELRAQAEGQDRFGAYHAGPSIEKGSDMILGAYFNAHKDLPGEYHNEPGLSSPNPQATIHQSMANFLRIKAFIALLKTRELTHHEFLIHVNDLNPALLLKVINYRKANQLPPLPFFDNIRTCEALKKFNQEITTQLGIDWSQDYLSIKRRACEQENLAFIRNPLALKNAVTFLSKTDGWFTGFNHYHLYQTSNELLWSKITTILTALYSLIVSIAIISILVVFLYYVSPIVDAFVAMYVYQAIFAYLGLSLINLFLNSRLIATVNDILFKAISLDYTFWLVVTGIILMELLLIVSPVEKIVSSVFALLDPMTNALSYFFTGKNEYSAETLESTCENTVIRLDGISEASAQGKSELLRGLLIQVKTDVNSDPGHSFKELLDKKYPVTYQGLRHNLSFSEVASMRRAHCGEFKVSDQPDRMRFFSGRTTTEALLVHHEVVPFQP